MVTRFKLKSDAEAFCRDLEDKYGIGVFHYTYHGHRHYCVQHNDIMQSIDVDHAESFERKS